MTAHILQSRKGHSLRGLLFCLSLLVASCGADTALVDFATLERATTPNDALACPPGLCSARTDFITEVVPQSAQELAAKVTATLLAEPRTELMMQDADGQRFVFVQRSRLFRFPDTVNVAIMVVDDSHATLAIYSHSNYGYGDLGVNRTRVEDWLAKIGVSVRATP
jgi:uncharacterized protein (DUF1499 family)